MRYRVLCLGFWALQAHAIETDNFTNRDAPLTDAGATIDAKMNEWIRTAIEETNARSPGRCDAEAFRKRFNKLAVKRGQYGTMKSRLEDWADEEATGPDAPVPTIPLKFSDSIYGAKHDYRKFLAIPKNRYVIHMAKSIRLHGHVVGLDKFSHFLAQGKESYELARKPKGLEKALRKNLREEETFFGFLVTGIKSYADAAATYSGYRFQVALVGEPDSHVVCGEGGQLQVNPERVFSFREYANDSWDEAINCADMKPRILRDVTHALIRGLPGARPSNESCPVAPEACYALAALPDAKYYVNPKCMVGPDSAAPSEGH